MANPVITNLAGDVALFTESDLFVLLDAGTPANVTDSDTEIFDGGRLTISITANEAPGEDRLRAGSESVVTSPGISYGLVVSSDFSNPRNVVWFNRNPNSYDQIIGRLVSDGSNGSDIVIDLGPDPDATAGTHTTLDEVIALIRAINYVNSNGNDPSALPRTITFTLTDGNDGSASLTTTVNVQPINDRPAIFGPSSGVTYENASTSGAGVNSNQTAARSSPNISTNSEFVVFHSNADNLVPNDTNGVADIFVKNLLDGSIERVSVSSDEQQANGASGSIVLSISADGRYVLFRSSASNLVPDDTNGVDDIFLRDTLTDQTTRVSVGSGGEQANATNGTAFRITNNGQFALFASDASLVPSDAGAPGITQTDLYVKNLATGEVRLASVNAAGDLGLNFSPESNTQRHAFFLRADMSDDGRYVAFETDADNMVPNYDQGPRGGTSTDVYLKDMLTGAVMFVSERNSGGASHDDPSIVFGGASRPKISADGRFVVFEANMDDLVANDTREGTDVFLWDRDAPAGSKLTLISTNSSGVQANTATFDPNISANGRYVVFESHATNLVSHSVPTGQGENENVFVKDLLTGEVRFVGQTTGGESDKASVTNDGQVIAFPSQNNLVPGDTDGEVDVYIARFNGSGSIPVLEDTLTEIRSISFEDVDAGNGEVTVTFSVTIGKLSQGVSNNEWGFSSDGLTVTVTDTLQAINDAIQAGILRYQPPPDYIDDVPLTVTINDNGNSGQDPSIPPNESESATATYTIDIIPVNDAPVIIGPSTTTSYYNASTSSAGANGSQSIFDANDAKLSGDGIYAAFSTAVSDLFLGDLNGHADVFRKNLQTGALDLVSVGLNGTLANGKSTFSSISADGRFVLFESNASNLVAGDTNGVTDVFVRDMLAGVTTRIVKSDGQQSFASFADRISDDGRYVLLSTIGAFVTADTDNAFSSYLYDRQTGTFRLNGDAGGQDMSADGRYIVYQSVDDVANGPNRQSFSNDVYLYDAVTGTTELVSTAFGGGYPQDGFHGSYRPHITADGRYVVYASDSGDILAPGVAAHSDYLFLWDRLTKTNTLVGTNVNGDPADASASHPYITRNGEFLIFKSAATNLVSPSAPPSTMDEVNFFLKNLSTGQVIYVGSGYDNSYPWVSEDGRVALFTSDLPLASGDNEQAIDIYAAFISASGGAIPVVEDMPSPIRGISFTDVDAGTGSVTVTFTVPRGTLSATSNGGVAVSSTATSVVLTGTIDNINTFLAQDRLLYTTALNDTAEVALGVAIDDGGNTGQDPGLTGTATSEADAETFTLTVIPVNDPPVAQDGAANGNEDAPVNGTLAASDVDSASLTFSRVTNAAHGTVVVNADGTFTYTPAANYFGPDSFTFRANDGALDSQTATVSLTINSVNDAPVASSSSTSGAKNQVQAGQASATDIDSSPLVYSLVDTTQHGTLAFLSNGAFTYTPGLDFEGTDSFTFKANDDQADSNVATVTIFVGDINDAPINTLPGTFDLEANVPAALTGLSVADDSGNGVITTTLSLQYGVLQVSSVEGATVSGSGSATVTINGTLAQINATLAQNNVFYSAPDDFFGTDTLTMTTDDHGFFGIGGPQSDTDRSAIRLNTYLQGTGGDDSFDALPGNSYVVALPGNDKITFNFALVDATVTYRSNLIIIDGPSSHTVLSGFETYVFTDGVVETGDTDRLVDDLFYYSRNHDVWNAATDADAHYHTFGWREGRDPNAFFDTSFYLSLNGDVAAANVDPVVHYMQFGWHEGRLPSLNFDPAKYFAAYPDVAAANRDPLEHFLRHGMEENRLNAPASGLIAPNGFDFSYYLLHNPDVAASGVDPLAHFNAFGWHEGRNPNALFDVSDYLANYADVAAAGVNPLDHYHAFGWHEGRDPSVDFDTGSYLAAYTDVAAVNRDPLQHYLQFGIHEGRSTFADGVWG